MNVIDNISALQKSFDEIKNSIEDVKDGYNHGNSKFASDQLEKSLYQSENNLIVMRDLYYALTPNYPEKIEMYMKKSSENMGISISPFGETSKAHKITLPFLLPNRRRNAMKFRETIGASLAAAVSQYLKTYSVQPFHHACVVFLSLYNYSEDKRIYIDNDNAELSDVLNIFNGTLIEDDKGTMCDILNFGRTTYTESHTEVYVSQRRYVPVILNSIFNGSLFI